MDSEDLFGHQGTEEFVINTQHDDDDTKILDQVKSQSDSINTMELNTNEHELNTDEIIQNVDEEEDNACLTDKNTIATANKAKTQEPKLVQLPLSKIRALMKLDPDMQLASIEAVFSVAKATELFIENLAKESYSFTAQSKKKTVQKRDVDLAIASVDSLMFLEGSMNF